MAEVRARSPAEFGELIHHPGEEYAHVLQDVIELHTDLYAPTWLSAGDAIYFDRGMGHACLAASTGPYRLLSLCSETPSHLLEVRSADQAAAVASVGAASTRLKTKLAKPVPRRTRQEKLKPVVVGKSGQVAAAKPAESKRRSKPTTC